MLLRQLALQHFGYIRVNDGHKLEAVAGASCINVQVLCVWVETNTEVDVPGIAVPSGS